MCQFPVCKEGDNCIYAHSADEKNYHPSIYKTKNCRFATENAICVANGIFCAFAHDDLRTPSISCISQDGRLDSLTLSQDFSTRSSIQPNAEEGEVKKEESKKYVKFSDFKLYKCRVTEAHDKKTCLYFHDHLDMRRDPLKINYCQDPCRVAFDFINLRFSNPNTCENNEKCLFAHNHYEI